MSSEKKWFPLESNPEVMTKYAEELGLDTSVFQFHDVLSTEDWALEMIPQPAVGVLMLFPIKDASEQYQQEEEERIIKDGQEVSPGVYYMKQIVGNACGTVGILHSIANARSSVVIKPDSYLQRFFEKTANMSPDEIAQYVNDDDEIEKAHGSATTEGQSELVMDVEKHFVCFSVVDGHLYELDGRKKFPINHGPCESSELLKKATEVIKGFMERDPGEVNFSMVALAAAAQEEA